MTLDEMKRIADARTKNEWVWGNDYLDWLEPGVITACHDGNFASQVECSKQDKAFIAMAANKWDKLMALVEAAKELIDIHPRDDFPYIHAISRAIEALEQD